MSRKDQLTGKGPLSGNKRSHALNHSRRKWNLNLQKTTIWNDGKKEEILVSARTLKKLKKHKRVVSNIDRPTTVSMKKPVTNKPEQTPMVNKVESKPLVTKPTEKAVANKNEKKPVIANSTKKSSNSKTVKKLDAAKPAKKNSDVKLTKKPAASKSTKK